MKKTSLFHLSCLLALPLLLSNCAAAKKLKMAEVNRETVRIWWEEGWNKDNNEALIERCYSPDWRDGNPLRANQTEGHEGMRQLVKSYRAGFPGARFTLTHIFATDRQVAVRYEVVARHEGVMFGIPATHKEFTSTGIVIYEMENGRIKTSWQELDLLGIMNQLKE
jgi:predicted ester cyclase